MLNRPTNTGLSFSSLNELQMLYNKKSLVQDGAFALEVMEYINRKVNEFKEEDGNLYAIYGTPAEACHIDFLSAISAIFPAFRRVSPWTRE